MLELEPGAEQQNRLSRCPSELWRSGSSRLWRQPSAGGFRRRSSVATCLAPPDPSSPPRLSLEQQREPLLDLGDDHHPVQPRLHRHQEQDDGFNLGCVPLRIPSLSSILSLASPPTSTSGGSQRRQVVWRDVARRVLGRSSSSIGRRGRSLPPDIGYVYDESSYAKNFDLGQESWHTLDEGFRRAAASEAQCRRSRTESATFFHDENF